MKLINKLCRLFVPTLMTLTLVCSWALGMASRPTDPSAPPPPAWVSVVPMVVMVVVFYFLLIRPQSKQRSEKQKMINNLKKGDRIITQGGFYAQVVSISEQVVEIKLNDEIRVKIQKSAVAEVLQGQNEPALIGVNGTNS